jgi:hypothetical protein
LDDEQPVLDEEGDVQQQQLRANIVAEMVAAMPSFFILCSLFGHLGPVCHTIFTAILATFLGLCALLRSCSNSKGGQSGATHSDNHRRRGQQQKQHQQQQQQDLCLAAQLPVFGGIGRLAAPTLPDGHPRVHCASRRSRVSRRSVQGSSSGIGRPF